MGLPSSVYSLTVYLAILPALLTVVHSRDPDSSIRQDKPISLSSGTSSAYRAVFQAVEDQITFAFEALEGHDWDSYDDYVEVPVHIPGCPAKEEYIISPLPYNLLGTGFYDLAHPFERSADPAYKRYSFPAMVFTNHTYTRQHTYEFQLIAMFMAHLRQFTSLYGPVNPNFCVWLEENILTAPAGMPEGLSVLEGLRRCIPNNDGQTHSAWQMPWLQTITSHAKSSAINGTEMVDQDTFFKYGWNRKISEIRGVSAVLSFLNNTAIKDDFIEQSSCVKAVWNVWYLAYGAAHQDKPVPPVLPLGMAGTYSPWVQNIVKGINDKVGVALENMITWFGDQAGGSWAPVWVMLDFASIMELGTPRSASDITFREDDLREYFLRWYGRNKINWWSQL